MIFHSKSKFYAFPKQIYIVTVLSLSLSCFSFLFLLFTHMSCALPEFVLIKNIVLYCIFIYLFTITSSILFLNVSSWKHTYIILTTPPAPPPPPPRYPLLYSKTGDYRDIHYFSYFVQNHRLWVLVRTLTSTHNLCIGLKYGNIRVFFWKFSVFGGEIFYIFE